MKFTKAQAAKKLAERTKDAWSIRYYTSWVGVAKALLQRGYTPIAAEAILRSKLTRWAADASAAPHGRVPVRDLLRYLDRFPNYVTDVLREEGLAS